MLAIGVAWENFIYPLAKPNFHLYVNGEVFPGGKVAHEVKMKKPFFLITI
jgi:hypothetical protein